LNWNVWRIACSAGFVLRFRAKPSSRFFRCEASRPHRPFGGLAVDRNALSDKSTFLADLVPTPVSWSLSRSSSRPVTSSIDKCSTSLLPINGSILWYVPNAALNTHLVLYRPVPGDSKDFDPGLKGSLHFAIVSDKIGVSSDSVYETMIVLGGIIKLPPFAQHSSRMLNARSHMSPTITEDCHTRRHLSRDRGLHEPRAREGSARRHEGKGAHASGRGTEVRAAAP
jgi:hypothetical protein